MFILFWIVFFVFVVMSFLLTGVIIIQEPKQGGLGEGLGGGGQDFSASTGGTSGGLQRMTIIMGGVWAFLALLLAFIPRA